MAANDPIADLATVQEIRANPASDSHLGMSGWKILLGLPLVSSTGCHLTNLVMNSKVK